MLLRPVAIRTDKSENTITTAPTQRLLMNRPVFAT